MRTGDAHQCSARVRPGLDSSCVRDNGNQPVAEKGPGIRSRRADTYLCTSLGIKDDQEGIYGILAAFGSLFSV